MFGLFNLNAFPDLSCPPLTSFTSSFPLTTHQDDLFPFRHQKPLDPDYYRMLQKRNLGRRSVGVSIDHCAVTKNIFAILHIYMYQSYDNSNHWLCFNPPSFMHDLAKVLANAWLHKCVFNANFWHVEAAQAGSETVWVHQPQVVQVVGGRGGNRRPRRPEIQVIFQP